MTNISVSNLSTEIIGTEIGVLPNEKGVRFRWDTGNFRKSVLSITPII